MERNRHNSKFVFIVLDKQLGAILFTILSFHVIRNGCVARKGTNQVGYTMYRKGREYAQSHIAKTSLEHRIQCTKNN